MRTILIIETWQWQDVIMAILKGLGHEFKVILAMTVRDADEAIKDPSQFDAVIVSGLLGSDRFATQHIPSALRQAGFTGPILANSNNDSYNVQLEEAGATASITSDKKNAAIQIVRLLEEHDLRSLIKPSTLALLMFARHNRKNDWPQLVSLVRRLPLTRESFQAEIDKIKDRDLSREILYGIMDIGAAMDLEEPGELAPLGEAAQAVLQLFSQEIPVPAV